MSRWATASVALLLAAALGTSSLASCLTIAAPTPQAQMACCKSGHDHCPMHRTKAQTASDCCRHDSQRQQELSAVEQPPVHVVPVAFQQLFAVTPQATVPPTPDSTSFFRYPRCASPPTRRRSLSTVLLI
jgi:hypothetical protein